jgi:hypothetical protein
MIGGVRLLGLPNEPALALPDMAQGKVVKPRKRCCKSRPRCKRCPVVCRRLERQGLATRRGDGRYVLAVTLRKKQLKAARV